MKPGGVGYYLSVVAPDRQVDIGNRRHVDEVYDLRKRIAKVRVAGAAITSVPTRVYGKSHQVGQPFGCVVGPGCLAARQGLKGLEIHRTASLRHEVGVDEVLVAELVASVLVNVGGHVFV